MARAAINQPTLGARAAPADAAVKRPSPVTSIRRRPKWSPSAAPVKSSTAKLRLYAFTVHWRASIDAPKSTRMVLRALVTTSASSATMNDATDINPRTQPDEVVRPTSVRICTSSRTPGAVSTKSTAIADLPSPIETARPPKLIGRVSAPASPAADGVVLTLTATGDGGYAGQPTPLHAPGTT